jgi:hypothetical protein
MLSEGEIVREGEAMPVRELQAQGGAAEATGAVAGGVGVARVRPVEQETVRAPGAAVAAAGRG